MMRYVPYALRGLKPVTNEPWARDEAIYRKNDGMDDTPGELDSLIVRTAADPLKDKAWDASLKPPEGAMSAYPK
jgi:hypothetical protein